MTPVQTLVMRYTAGGWRVAGVGRWLTEPGWPPPQQELPSEYP
jgi:hypothetical protein